MTRFSPTLDDGMPNPEYYNLIAGEVRDEHLRLKEEAARRAARPNYVPAHRTAEHIKALLAHGWNIYGITEIAGVSKQCCKRILDSYEENPNWNVHVTTEQAILSIPIIERDSLENLFDAKAKLLLDVGFTKDEIAALSGISAPTLFHRRGSLRLGTMKKLDEAWPIFEKRITARAELIKRFGKLAQQNRATKDVSDS